MELLPGDERSLAAEDAAAVAPADGVEDDPSDAILPDDDAVQAIIRESERVIREPLSGASNSFALYLHELQKYPVLSSEQEYKLAVAARNGSTEAQEALVRHNLRFCITIARKHLSHGVAIEDLVQEGNIGLLKAVTRFNPDRGVKFVSYAVYWIQQSIRAGLATLQRSVRLPINRATQLAKIQRTVSELARQLRRTPSPQEVAAASGIPLHMVQTLQKVSQSDLSFDAPRPNEEEGSMVLAERIGTESRMSSVVERKDRNAVLASALTQLRARDERVLRLAFGIDGGREHTLEEIGDILSITRERVRQIRDRALKELRAAGQTRLLADYHLTDGLDD